MNFNIKKNLKESLLWEIFIKINRYLLKVFFDKKYLSGKWFDKSLVGWKWAWKAVLWQKVFGFNRHVKWPVVHTIKITEESNIDFHPDELHIFQANGCYFQTFGKITIKKGTLIAPNVGIITANHTVGDLEHHDEAKDVVIGENCWIGMNSVILPGCILGNHTIVGAGSVVTKPFEDGYCIIGGVPAKLIRKIENIKND